MENDWKRKQIQEQESWRIEAHKSLAEAMDISRLSADQAEEISVRFQLRPEDTYIYELELAPWQLSQQKIDERSRAATLFLEAGKRFRRCWSMEEALKCFQLARYSARLSKGEEFRESEIDAVHFIAEVYLTLSERPKNGNIYSEQFIGEEQNRKTNEFAAIYQELEGHLKFNYGDKEAAAITYSSASFRYGIAKYFEKSARAAGKEAEIWLSINNLKMAAQAFEKQSIALFKAGQNKPEIVVGAVSALFQSGRVLSKIDGQKGQAADLLLKAAKQALQLPEWKRLEEDVIVNKEMDVSTNFGPFDADRKVVNMQIKIGAAQRGAIPDSLTLAESLFNDIGEFSKADHCHYVLSQYRRTKYAAGKIKRLNPLYLFSLLLDMLWGYGTRPLRLIFFGFAVTLSFAIFYFLIGDVNLETNTAVDNQIIACVTLSASSFAPARIIESISKLNLLPAMKIGSVSLVAVWVEALFGLVFWAMVGFWIIRWFKRQFVPK